MTPTQLADAMDEALLERGWVRHDVAEPPPGPLLVLRDKRMRVLRAWAIPDNAEDFPQLPGLYAHLVDGATPVVLLRNRTGEWTNLADGEQLTGVEVRSLLPLERLVAWETAVDEVLGVAQANGFLTEGLGVAIRAALRGEMEGKA